MCDLEWDVICCKCGTMIAEGIARKGKHIYCEKCYKQMMKMWDEMKEWNETVFKRKRSGR